MTDSILDLKTPWIPVTRELGGQTWRLRYSNAAFALLAEHFGSEKAAGEALGSLIRPGPKKVSILIAYLWAGLQSDAYEKYRKGLRKDETLPLQEVEAWIKDYTLDELFTFFRDIFGAYNASLPNG